MALALNNLQSLIYHQTKKPNQTYLRIRLKDNNPSAQLIQYLSWGSPRGVMVNVIDCGIVVSEFELLSFYYFRINTLGKGMNPFILPAMG